MEDDDPNAEKVLQLSYEIVQLIEQNADYFDDAQTQEVLTANDTIKFFLDNDNTERALNEANNLKKYLIKLTKK
jgi:hypothetical protein